MAQRRRHHLGIAFIALAFLVGCSSSPPKLEVTPPAPEKKPVPWDRFASSVILKTDRGKATFICSAVLLSKRIGLTTAHCLSQSRKNEIVVGTSLTDPAKTVIPILQSSVRIHPEYQPKKSLSHADLALFKLSADAKLDTFPSIPEESDLKLAPGQALDRVGFGLRNGTNSRTWTEVFFEKVEGGILVLTDSLSVNGDSGSPVYDSVDENFRLLGLHTTLLQPSHLAAVNLPHFKKWIETSTRAAE